MIGPYLKGAKHITITDPYIRLFYQTKNLMELLEMVVKQKQEDDEIVVSLITVEDELKGVNSNESILRKFRLHYLLLALTVYDVLFDASYFLLESSTPDFQSQYQLNELLLPLWGSSSCFCSIKVTY
ncbi:MIT C-terminal domain-containing protein [Photobacterium kishitanii]|uniref:MIT C-terminal domain-containing protein n=1 Tax=Photobacterium kishitanii TaxID=318456 RepID=UPI003AFA3061